MTTTAYRVATAPGALPLLGHTPQLLRAGLLSFVESLPAHGDLVEIRLGPRPAYVLCHPDLTQQVLLDDRTFDKGGSTWERFRAAGGTGLVSCPHRDHRRQRRMFQPAFHRGRLPAYAAVMSAQAAAITGGWRDGQIIDVPAQMRAYTSRVISGTVFSGEHAARAAAAVEDSLGEIIRGMRRQVGVPVRLLHRVPVAVNRRSADALAQLEERLGRTISGYRRRQPDSDQATGTGDRAPDSDHADVLSLVMAARDDDDQEMSDTELHEQLVGLLATGVETATSALSWAMDLLSRHAVVQRRLQREVDAVLGGRVATFEDLSHLPLTRRVIVETLRLYPPAWLLTRTTSAATEIAGRKVPAGATVVCSPYLIHRHPSCYPDPERFDPDRWLPERVAERQRAAFVPFGAGVRRCIGDAFGMTESTLMLASVVSRWRLQATTTRPTESVARLSLAPRSLQLRLFRRPLLVPRSHDLPA